MADDDINDLKKALFDAYEGFGDKRIKKLESGDYFIVDDRTPQDHDAKGKLFPWFCLIAVRVKEGGKVEVNLSGGVPESPTVTEWFEKMGAKAGPLKRVTIKAGQEDALLELAHAFRAIVAPGARYEIRAYKYVCPRAASSLRKLRDVLHKAWTA